VFDTTLTEIRGDNSLHNSSSEKLGCVGRGLVAVVALCVLHKVYCVLCRYFPDFTGEKEVHTVFK
jgi:hypothetical protein